MWSGFADLPGLGCGELVSAHVPESRHSRTVGNGGAGLVGNGRWKDGKGLTKF